MLPADDEGRREEAHGGDVVWVKARDTLLGAAPKGRTMDDGEAVEAEAALVLTVPGADEDSLIIIEGSHRRLLKTLEYARSALLGTAPAMELVHNIGDGAPGLRCPHCGFTAWAGVCGITVVEGGERYTDVTLRTRGQRLELVGDFAEAIDGEWDHHECTRCARPVAVPEEIPVVQA